MFKTKIVWYYIDFFTTENIHELRNKDRFVSGVPHTPMTSAAFRTGWIIERWYTTKRSSAWGLDREIVRDSASALW